MKCIVTYYNNAGEIVVKTMTKSKMSVFFDISNVQIINVKPHNK